MSKKTHRYEIAVKRCDRAIVFIEDGLFVAWSSWGCYAYNWSARDAGVADIREFFARVRGSLDYFRDKFSYGQKGVQAPETIRSVRESICQIRRERYRPDRYTKEWARREWKLVGELEDGMSLDAWYMQTEIEDALEHVYYGPSAQCRAFVDEVMPRLAEMVRAELEKEKNEKEASRVRPQRPARGSLVWRDDGDRGGAERVGGTSALEELASAARGTRDFVKALRLRQEHDKLRAQLFQDAIVCIAAMAGDEREDPRDGLLAIRRIAYAMMRQMDRVGVTASAKRLEAHVETMRHCDDCGELTPVPPTSEPAGAVLCPPCGEKMVLMDILGRALEEGAVERGAHEPGCSVSWVADANLSECTCWVSEAAEALGLNAADTQQEGGD